MPDNNTNGETTIKKRGPKAKTLVRVHRSNVDPDNRNLPIYVCVNNPSEKLTFWPGEEVKLTESQISVLKDSVEEVRIIIPSESGIYEAKNPIVAAKNYYPDMTPAKDPVTGLIVMTQRVPNYIIETVG